LRVSKEVKHEKKTRKWLRLEDYLGKVRKYSERIEMSEEKDVKTVTKMK
jgi:hypothetical protein